MKLRPTASTTAFTILAFVIGLLVLHSQWGKPAGVSAAELAMTNQAGWATPSDSADISGHAAEVYQGSFFYSTSEQMLQALKVTVYPEDKVTAFPDPSLGIGSVVKVYRAQPVLLTDGDTQTLVRSWAKTVGDLLAEQRVSVAEKDIIVPPVETPVTVGSAVFSIAITRVSESPLQIKTDIAFQTVTKDDPTALVGTQSVGQVGQKGVLQTTYLVRRENGVEVTRTVTDQTVLKDPVNQIILKGTKPKVKQLSTGAYKDYINQAALQYGVPADKLYKLMMCESGGNIYSDNGYNKGLFQYAPSTWSHTAYGSSSIYDPQAQINAAASQWGSRYSMWPTCSQGL